MPDARREHIAEPLTLEESCRVIREAAEAGFVCLEISGEGEPLLSKNIEDIVQCADDCGLITTVITNGHALTDRRIQFFFERNVTLIVSLFSLDEKQYESDNKTPGSYEKVMRNLKKAAEVYKAGKKTINDAEIYRVAVHTTAQTDNLDGLRAIADFCEQHEIFFSVAPLASVGGGAAMHDAMLSGKQYGVVDGLGDNSIILSQSSSKEVGREVCGTCLYGLNLSYNGNVLLDAHAGYELEGTLGSVRTESVAELVKRQRVFAPFLFRNIKGFCPVRDPEWPAFLERMMSDKNFSENI
jgi:MoaA/NifB/PqqE/SkfB family radical SAM enzyme